MLSDLELATALYQLPRALVTQVRLLIASGWVYEAERVLAEAMGDPGAAAEIVASLVRRQVIHE